MDVFCFELSKLFVNSSATDIVLVTLSSTAVETAVGQCTSRWAMARGHRLNTSIVLATVSPVFFGRFPRSSLHSVVPFPFCTYTHVYAHTHTDMHTHTFTCMHVHTHTHTDMHTHTLTCMHARTHTHTKSL